MDNEIFENILERTLNYRQNLQNMPIISRSVDSELNSGINPVLPIEGEAPEIAIQALVDGVEEGLINNANPRYFGFVVGASTPVSIAADWLTSIWNQNGQVYITSPAAAVMEDIVAQWVLDLLNLPRSAGVGFVTGSQMANYTSLTVARNTVLQRAGWNVENDGLQGSPHINVLCADVCHGTIHSAIQMMGLGKKNIVAIGTDSDGCIEIDALERALDACAGPTIICAQAGNVNTGSFDSFIDIVPLAKKHGAWLHIDGAFGLWAGASEKTENLVSHAELADSWSVDAHKMLNIPYDSGIVIIRDPDLHRVFKATRCAYAGTPDLNKRDGSQWVPENSRRARGFVLYAALRNLGRKGVRELVENCCDLAGYFASQLARLPHARVLNKVVFNQIMCRLEPDCVSDIDAFNSAVALRIQKAGVCWIGTSQWQGKITLRISISNYLTTREDIDKSMESIRDAMDEELKHCIPMKETHACVLEGDIKPLAG